MDPLSPPYFIYKYAHVGPGSPYSFSQVVSADILGFNPAKELYVPPVTYGLMSEITYDYGLIFGLLAMAISGALFAYLNDRGFKRPSVLRILLRSSLLLGGFDLVSKGGIVYSVLNWTVVALGLSNFAAIVRICPFAGKPSTTT